MRCRYSARRAGGSVVFIDRLFTFRLDGDGHTLLCFSVSCLLFLYNSIDRGCFFCFRVGRLSSVNHYRLVRVDALAHISTHSFVYHIETLVHFFLRDML